MPEINWWEVLKLVLLLAGTGCVGYYLWLVDDSPAKHRWRRTSDWKLLKKEELD